MGQLLPLLGCSLPSGTVKGQKGPSVLVLEEAAQEGKRGREQGRERGVGERESRACGGREPGGKERSRKKSGGGGGKERGKAPC